MLGGGRRDDGSLVMNNTNVFAALDSLRRKKKSDKDRKSKSSKAQSAAAAEPKEPEPQVFWSPAPLNSKSWADVDDDDDDDYYATTAPPQAVWGSSEPEQSKETPSNVEDTDSEEDILDEGDGDDDVEEEHDNGAEVLVHPELAVKKSPEVSVAPKEAERQLSKKERKKKELAELDALLADFGVTPKENDGQDESSEAAKDKDVGPNGDGEKKDNPNTESKSAKKKKKKDKSSKEVKELQDQPNNSEVGNGSEEAASEAQQTEDISAVDVKERLKKMASMKKKKSSKEMDAAAKAAGQEAKERNARLAAAKKKEKGHYNQQPLR